VDIGSATILLFLVMDPVGNIPFFLSALEPVAPERHKRVVVRELLIALGLMVAFLFAGQPLLRVLGISEPALTIAGGVVLFLIALKMVFPPTGKKKNHDDDLTGEPFIVPLAVPYVAGPSVLATEMLLMSREPARWAEWLVVVGLAWVASAIILFGASLFRSYLSRRGMIAMERLMGMVLVAISIQMFLSGVEKYVKQFGAAGLGVHGPAVPGPDQPA
jgi:MarC family membrane protein